MPCSAKQMEFVYVYANIFSVKNLASIDEAASALESIGQVGGHLERQKQVLALYCARQADQFETTQERRQALHHKACRLVFWSFW